MTTPKTQQTQPDGPKGPRTTITSVPATDCGTPKDGFAVEPVTPKSGTSLTKPPKVSRLKERESLTRRGPGSPPRSSPCVRRLFVKETGALNEDPAAANSDHPVKEQMLDNPFAATPARNKGTEVPDDL